MSNQPPQPGDPVPVIAFLHCEIPSAGKPASLSPNAGTVDLDEVDSDAPASRETISLYEGQAFRVGRARANELVIENPSVSRFHAVFSASASGVVLSDLSSLNGTHLNGRRITTPVDLVTGDIIGIGSVKVTIEMSRGIAPEVDAEEDADSNETLVSTHAAKMSTVMITVMVADVCGFTRLSQVLPPQEVAEMLNVWFRKSVGAIIAHGGEVDKYIGDCVMALWRSTEDPSEAAVRATLAAEQILMETKNLDESGVWPHHVEFPWRCRVALNTGEALMGALGVAGNRDYTVLGDTVNIAFRLESLASAEGSALVLSEATARLVRDLLPLKSLGHVILEGRKDNVEIFTVDR